MSSLGESVTRRALGMQYMRQLRPEVKGSDGYRGLPSSPAEHAANLDRIRRELAVDRLRAMLRGAS